MTDKELIQTLREASEYCECLVGNNAADRLEALLADNEQLREATKMVGKDTNVPTSAEDSPTVDAVEVVFCKDCKHQEDCIGRIELMGRNLVLELNTYECHPLKFCSYGERRTDDEPTCDD